MIVEFSFNKLFNEVADLVAQLVEQYTFNAVSYTHLFLHEITAIEEIASNKNIFFIIIIIL